MSRPTAARAEGALRLFIAIELPDPIRALLERELEALRALRADLGLVRAAQLHVTLRFLGDTDPTRIAEVEVAMREAAERHAPFPLRIEGAGRFPPRGAPRVFWVGLGGEVAALASLAHDLEGALRTRRFAPEPKPFTAHVTLGRARGPRGLRDVEAHLATRGPTLRSEDFDVAALRLFRSELLPGGVVHTVLCDVPFGNAPR
ncbi:MAG: RNA 2',3'-cyclic phosphodiesterase [Planctomycetes bacterium]|nr:RNA 2',3'-cyclic phosphodiesterase [Planctomycetota bacterium]